MKLRFLLWGLGRRRTPGPTPPVFPCPCPARELHFTSSTSCSNSSSHLLIFLVPTAPLYVSLFFLLPLFSFLARACTHVCNVCRDGAFAQSAVPVFLFLCTHSSDALARAVTLSGFAPRSASRTFLLHCICPYGALARPAKMDSPLSLTTHSSHLVVSVHVACSPLSRDPLSWIRCSGDPVRVPSYSRPLSFVS